MSLIKVKSQNNFLHISLNRPEKRNALDESLMKEIISAFNGVSMAEDYNAVILSGEGKSFCAGADLKWMKKMVDYTFDENLKDSYLLFDVFESIYNCPLPVITKAHGHVFGGGLGLLAASDYVLAEGDTKFSFSEVKLGLIPAVISSFILAKCNLSFSNALMTSGEVFNLNDALNLGLVHKDASEYENVLKSYSSASKEALIECKKLIKKQKSLNPTDYKEYTAKMISEIRVSKEAQNRMTNFLRDK